MKKLELGCVGIPRYRTGTFFTTIYDHRDNLQGFGCLPGENPGIARAVFNFASEEEAKEISPLIIDVINKHFERTKGKVGIIRRMITAMRRRRAIKILSRVKYALWNRFPWDDSDKEAPEIVRNKLMQLWSEE